MTTLLRIIPVLIFWGIFGYVVLQIPYPNSLTEASIFQLLAFFIPLFLGLTFTINLFLNFLVRSILISLTLVILLILQALQSLNIITFILTLLAFGLLVSYFKKRKGLTSAAKIPKLTHWRKRNVSS